MLSDTSPEAEKVQIELLRRATPAERLAREEWLSAMTRKASRGAIARANPDLSAREIDLKCVELFYGPELAAALRGYARHR